ncbi:hypothetical protein AAVH_24508 [Aphelenchoides avenae]|nr:hypothetical protein AAVH_24508 [Aphelenchus avenae]
MELKSYLNEAAENSANGHKRLQVRTFTDVAQNLAGKTAEHGLPASQKVAAKGKHNVYGLSRLFQFSQ